MRPTADELRRMNFGPPQYHLTFQFRSNERPWSGRHDARGIETDDAAMKWARYFVDKIGDDYQITLFKNGVVMPMEHWTTELQLATGGN